MELKDKWGFGDPRNTKEYENCDICANDIFRETWTAAGVERNAFDAPPAMGGAKPSGATNGSAGDTTSNQEALVKMITERVMAELAK